MTACKNCGCSDINTSHGEAVCNSCGAVVESSIIVSEVQFQENSAGVSTVVGQFVSYEGLRTFGRDSRQVTLQNAKTRITNIASRLNMGSQCIDMAYKLFKLALSKGLTKGRKSNHIAAACLYIVCRMEKKPLMLLDFSDKLEVDVYTLGHTYLRLSTELYIVIPAMDPCLYIERYAHRLEFGDKTLEVCKTANRLVSRMDRDWMVQGRRPSGICGAALLVAARIFNFNRTIKDIIKVVRIGERTIKNRLNEFEQTPSSKLTIDEFNSVNLEESMDPPSFTAGLKRAKLNELEDGEKLPKLLEEAELLRNELEEEIQEITHKKPRKYKKFFGFKDSDETLSLCSVAPSLEDLDEELAQYQHLFLHAEGAQLSRINSMTSVTSDVSNGDRGKEGTDGERTGPNSGPNSPLRPAEDDPEVERLVTSELEDILNQTISSQEVNTAAKNSMTGLKESIEECLSQGCEIVEETEDELDGELDLEGIDDEELDEMILNEDEVKIKTIRWMREHAEYLKELKEKEEKKAKELLENPKSFKKKRKPRKAKPRVEASTAREAIEKILQENKLSDKINYDILMDFNIGSMKKSTESANHVDLEIQRTNEIQVETYPSPLEKKIKIDTSDEAFEVEKQETAHGAEEDDEHFYFDKEENEPQQTNNEPQCDEPYEDFDNYYCDSD